MRLLPERSTVKLREPLQADGHVAVDLQLVVVQDDLHQLLLGHRDSRQRMPLPWMPRLKRPSLPRAAEDRLEPATALCFRVDSQARNRPSSRTMEPFQSRHIHEQDVLIGGLQHQDAACRCTRA